MCTTRNTCSAHPHVAVAPSLHQDQLLGDAEATLCRFGAGAILDRLHEQACAANADASNGRIRSDRIEPEPLFWAAWHVLPDAEKYAIAREAIGGFVERVQQAASFDPRAATRDDPMEWHRHRIHPLLWKALDAPGVDARDPLQRQRQAWIAHKRRYRARRPTWSQLRGARPPWAIDHAK